MTSRDWTNERGNKVTQQFIGGDRYRLDFEVCTREKVTQQFIGGDRYRLDFEVCTREKEWRPEVEE